MRDTAEEIRTNSEAVFAYGPFHTDERIGRPASNSLVQTQHVVWKSCRKRWTIEETNGDGESEKYVQAVQHDDDDICIYIYIYIYIYTNTSARAGYDTRSICIYIYIYIYIYIVIHRQTVSFYQNSSVWLDPQDARSRDRNLSNFTIDYIFGNLSNIYIYIYIYIYMFERLPKIYCSVGWVCRIHQLHHCRGVRPQPRNACPRYETKQSVDEVPVILEYPFIAIAPRSTLARGGGITW